MWAHLLQPPVLSAAHMASQGDRAANNNCAGRSGNNNKRDGMDAVKAASGHWGKRGEEDLPHHPRHLEQHGQTLVYEWCEEPTHCNCLLLGFSQDGSGQTLSFPW